MVLGGLRLMTGHMLNQDSAVPLFLSTPKHTHIHTRTNTHTRTNANTYTHTHTHKRTNTPTRTNANTYTHTHKRKHTHTSPCLLSMFPLLSPCHSAKARHYTHTASRNINQILRADHKTTQTYTLPLTTVFDTYLIVLVRRVTKIRNLN